MKRLAPVVIGWWFIAIAGSQTPPTQHGPFDNEQNCNLIREQLSKRAYVTVCWFEGRWIKEQPKKEEPK